MNNQFDLFGTRRFWPLFWVQFLGAFNDNLMKTAIVVLVAYGLWDIGGMNPAVLVSLAAAVFIVPFVLFCPLAGEVTDKIDKALIVRWVKKAEIVIVLLAIAALFFQSIIFAFVILFALGAQSAIFSPAKYALLPQHLHNDELIAGNGLIATGTYLAILLGTILGALLAPMQAGVEIVCVILLLAALAGYGASVFVPEALPEEEKPKIERNVLRSIRCLISDLKAQPHRVFWAVIGVSWFYLIAGLFHAQFPNYASQTLGVDNVVLTFFMIVFSVGIAAGGLLNNRLLKAKVDLKLVPFALAGIAFFAGDLYLVSLPYAGHGSGLMTTGFAEFIASPDGVRITLDLFLLSLCGGLYVVPLRSYVQHFSRPAQKARVVAGNSVMDALFILFAALAASVLLWLGLEVIDLFLMAGVACAVLAVLGFRHKDFLKGDV